MTKITYKIDGVVYNSIPNYLKKDSFMRPVTAENFTIETITEEIDDAAIAQQKQRTKSLALKQAENDYLSVVSLIPGVVTGDNSNIITMKLETSTELTDVQKVSIGLKLLAYIHDVELAGGSFYDLPSVPHVITK